MNFLVDICKINKEGNPNNTAVITERCTLSYSELQKESVEAAGILLNSGVVKDDYVPVLCENNKDFIILVLALWLIDAVPVPINIKLTQKEIEQLLLISKSKKIFVHENLWKSPPDGRAGIPVGKDNFAGLPKIIFPLDKNDEKNFSIASSNDINRTAVVIFTSGSTAAPKGVMLSFKNLIRSAEIGNQILNQTSKDRWLASLPFYHIGGFSIITRALLYGASLIIPTSSDTKDFVKCIAKFKPSLASFVSTQLKRLLDNKIKPNQELRNVLLGGGFVDDELISSAVQNGWKIIKVYGSSETSSFVSALAFNEIKIKGNSVGKVLFPNKIKIVDENRKTLPAGVSGEIVVMSDSVMKGYLNNEEETVKRLADGHYFTGDIGRLDDDGYLFIEARRSDLIITGGENVNPLEIENAILQHKKIRECCVVGLENKTWGHIVAAAVVPADTKMNKTEITKFLQGKLAGYKIPKKFLFVDKLPENALGKIEKEKVKNLFRE